MLFRLVRAWGKILSPRRNRISDLRIPRSDALPGGGLIPHGESEFFLCPTRVRRRKNIFLYFFTELKTFHVSYSIWGIFS